MLSVRQKLGIATRWIEVKVTWCAALSGYDGQTRECCKENRTLFIPVSAVGGGGRERSDGLCVGIDALQLTLGEKRNCLAVRRPERHPCVFGIRQGNCGLSVE